MGKYNLHLLNALSLVLVGFWGYLDVMSPTALIPVFFGALLLILYFINKSKKKTFLEVLSLCFTLLILFALSAMRLPKSLDAGGVGLVRVIVMILTSSLSSFYFIKALMLKK